MRRAPLLRLLAVLLGLPAMGSALVVLTVPPAADHLPRGARDALAPAADVAFGLVARLPPDSLAGRLFHASFAPLPAVFGSGALAAHAALLGLPWAALAVALEAWSRRAASALP